MSDERHESPGAGVHEGGAAAEGATTQDASTTGKRTFVEEFQVSGERVVEKIKELIREGNVRRITLKNEKGETLIEIPLTIGVIGTLLLPVWAGIGAIAALVANLTLSVERVADPAAAPPPNVSVPAEGANRP